MFSWVERIRQKSENTRRAVATVLFLVIAGFVLTIWLWDLQGSFPYNGAVSATDSLISGLHQGIQSFQDFRFKLGEIKQNMLNAVSRRQEESTASTTENQNQ